MKKINQKWVFGKNAGLNFSGADANNPPLSMSVPSMDTNEGCACISDANGDLLFYTDGVNVYDSVGNQKIPNLSLGIPSLLGHPSSTQSSIIVPDPGNSDRFYILTTDGSSHFFADAQPSPNNPPNHFAGVRLDINTWGVEHLSNIPNYVPPTTADFSPTERITAIQNKDCTAFWVITIIQKGDDATQGNPGVTSGKGFFRIFLIDSGGITHFADKPMQINVNERGYLKCSPNSKTLAIANGNSNILLYPFDNDTGGIIISGLRTIALPNINNGYAVTMKNVYGVEFSPNSDILYYGNLVRDTTSPNLGNKGYIFQVDITPQSLLISELVATFPNETPNSNSGRYIIGALQLGIDGRIYIAKDREATLGAIMSPDTLGVGCNVQISYITLALGTTCYMGLPNLLPNPCKEGACDCGCAGCNDNPEEQNVELIERAQTKYNIIKSKNSCSGPFAENCDNNAISGKVNLEPCFYFHWGDGANDQIEEHDTEVFYITVCNDFNDIQYNGLRITKITLIPDHPIDKIQIVPDRFINLDCLEPCSCQTREFAMITRANDTAGTYKMEVEYCYENVEITSKPKEGKVEFGFEISED